MSAIRYLSLFLLLASCAVDGGKVAPLKLTVMSFNTYGAGANQGDSIEDTVAVLRAVNADVVALLEVQAESDPCTSTCPPAGPSRAPEIAAALGYKLYEQTAENEALWANAILSKYPILNGTDHDLGAVIDVDGRKIAMFGIHLNDYPYQPYQLLGIPYSDAPFLHSADAAVVAARAARGTGLDLLLSDIDSVPDADAVFVAGDFNEPSHRDWSERAAALGRHPFAVRFPATLRLEAAGFVDSFRAAYPDEIAKPGYTWTPTSAADDPDDHHDRIDYIFVRASKVQVLSAAVVGEQQPDADIVVTPWPSDHRAVVTTVLIP